MARLSCDRPVDSGVSDALHYARDVCLVQSDAGIDSGAVWVLPGLWVGDLRESEIVVSPVIL